MRKPELTFEKQTLFQEDITLSHGDMLEQIKRIPNESDQDYAERINSVIQNGIAHVLWDDIDVDKYYIRIPLWENYLLHFLSYSPFFDDFKKYHFRDHYKSMERGIGVCGDAAMILSRLLDEQKIDNSLIAFDGHVIVEVYIESLNDDFIALFDPDFGVIMPFGIKELIDNPNLIEDHYKTVGYSEKKIELLKRIYHTPHNIYKDVRSFGPTTYDIEYLSYKLIWGIPFFMIVAGLFLLRFFVFIKL